MDYPRTGNSKLADAFITDIDKCPDIINSPKHYTAGGIETIDFIEAKKLGYHLGNAIKYISRAGKKDSSKYEEDLQKAKWYIDRAIKLHRKEKREYATTLSDILREYIRTL